MLKLPEALDQVSMVAANFGNAAILRDVLNDWFAFLGGRPGEVCIVDGGSDERTRRIYWDLFNEGMITKLQIIRPEHRENHKDFCYYQEHAAGAIAGRPNLLWFKSDTLPYRQGHDNWLSQALDYLERDDTFAVGGSFNMPSKHHDAWPGWYFSHKCSENFALMKRTSFMSAMEEFAGRYITSGFTGPSPAADTGQERFLVEVAFERYIQRHQQYTLVKVEDPTWTVFHTNVQGEKLIRVRQDYLARKNIEKYMNHGYIDPLQGACYYGQSRRWWKEFRVALGASALGPRWRSLKRWMERKKTARP